MGGTRVRRGKSRGFRGRLRTCCSARSKCTSRCAAPVRLRCTGDPRRHCRPRRRRCRPWTQTRRWQPGGGTRRESSRAIAPSPRVRVKVMRQLPCVPSRGPCFAHRSPSPPPPRPTPSHVCTCRRRHHCQRMRTGRRTIGAPLANGRSSTPSRPGRDAAAATAAVACADPRPEPRSPRRRSRWTRWRGVWPHPHGPRHCRRSRQSRRTARAVRGNTASAQGGSAIGGRGGVCWPPYREIGVAPELCRGLVGGGACVPQADAQVL